MKRIIKEFVGRIIIPAICMITSYSVVNQLFETMGWVDDVRAYVVLLAVVIFCITIILYLSLKGR